MKKQTEALRDICGGELSGLLSSSVSKIYYMLIPVNICALILLQTDSSPSLSFAQLAKVLFLPMLAVTPEKLIRWVVFLFLFFLEGLTLF